MFDNPNDPRSTRPTKEQLIISLVLKDLGVTVDDATLADKITCATVIINHMLTKEDEDAKTAAAEQASQTASKQS